MTITEQIIQKVQGLSAEDQKRVIDLLDNLVEKTSAPAERQNPMGMFAHHGVHVSAEDIAEAREEMWGSFPHS